jgi:hypothetical protein
MERLWATSVQRGNKGIYKKAEALLLAAPIYSFFYPLKTNVPATPQRPKPELRIVDPLCTSATAASASLNSFELCFTAVAESTILVEANPRRMRWAGGAVLRVRRHTKVAFGCLPERPSRAVANTEFILCLMQLNSSFVSELDANEGTLSAGELAGFLLCRGRTRCSFGAKR